MLRHVSDQLSVALLWHPVAFVLALLLGSCAGCSRMGAEFMSAVSRNDLQKTDDLLRANPDLVSKRTSNRSRETPLNLAATHGYRQMVSLLLANRADVNAKDANGLTALHDAAAYGERDVVEILLARGADCNAKDNKGDTPLHYAVGCSPSDSSRSAMDAPLSFAARYKTTELLLSKGASVNAEDDEGWTPLHFAVKPWPTQLFGPRPESHRLLELLLEAGANAGAANKEGWTPLHYVSDVREDDLAKMEMLLRKLVEAKIPGPIVNRMPNWKVNPILGKALVRMGWKPTSERQQVYFSICTGDLAALKRQPDRTSRILIADMRSGDYDRTENAVNTLISLGRTDVIPELLQLLNTHGTEEIAETYLNCGQKELSDAATAWARSRGFLIIPGGSRGGGISWGSW